MSDLISRQDALSCFHDWIDSHGDVHTADEMPEYQRIEQLPSTQPEEFEWCTDCKEYDQTQHCCHRWTKVIRGTVEELKAQPDFDITAKIDKAYDRGYEAGYLQAQHDWGDLDE